MACLRNATKLIGCQNGMHAWSYGSRLAHTLRHTIQCAPPHVLRTKEVVHALPQDASRELCHSLLRLTSLTRLSLLSLPSCRQLLPRLEELQALRHMPILELSPS